MICRRCNQDRPERARSLCASCYENHRHEFPKPAAYQPWTTREVLLLRKLRLDGVAVKQIAALMGRSAKSVQKASSRFDLPIGPYQKGKGPVIRRMHAQGLEDAEIANRLKMSRRAVRSARRRLGLLANVDLKARYRRTERILGQSLASYRRERERHATYSEGWPLRCAKERARQLELFESAGWLTVEEFAERMGLKVRSARDALFVMCREGWVISRRVAPHGAGTRREYGLAESVRKRRREVQDYLAGRVPE